MSQNSGNNSNIYGRGFMGRWINGQWYDHRSPFPNANPPPGAYDSNGQPFNYFEQGPVYGPSNGIQPSFLHQPLHQPTYHQVYDDYGQPAVKNQYGFLHGWLSGNFYDGTSIFPVSPTERERRRAEALALRPRFEDPAAAREAALDRWDARVKKIEEDFRADQERLKEQRKAQEAEEVAQKEALERKKKDLENEEKLKKQEEARILYEEENAKIYASKARQREQRKAE